MPICLQLRMIHLNFVMIFREAIGVTQIAGRYNWCNIDRDGRLNGEQIDFIGPKPSYIEFLEKTLWIGGEGGMIAPHLIKSRGGGIYNVIIHLQLVELNH